MSALLFEKKRHVFPCQHIRHYPRALANQQEDVLHIVVIQYIPKSNPTPRPGDITLVAAHANGVCKELYEPLWDEVVQQVQKSGKVRIRSIWMADVAFQGESGVLNENKIGNDPSWFDHPRDMLHMINHFREQMPRPLVGIGHSMGGHNIVSLALIHPRLFTSVILIDPVIQRYTTALGHFAPALASTFRRDLWPSRQAAAESFRQNKFYQGWDRRVLELWIEYGLRELPTKLYPTESLSDALKLSGGSLSEKRPQAFVTSPSFEKPVTLTTSKHQEVLTFLRANHPENGVPLSQYKANPATHSDIPMMNPTAPFYRPEPLITFGQLPFLRPGCLYIFAESSPLSTLEMRKDKMEVTGTGVGGSGGVLVGAVDDVVMGEGAGHFVPFERPLETAAVVVGWLERYVVGSVREEEREGREWLKVARRERAMWERDRPAWMRAKM